MMLFALTLTSMTFCVKAFDPEGLFSFLDGYYSALQLENDVKALHPCIEEYIGNRWDAFFNELVNVEWNNAIQVALAFTKIIEPALGSLSMVRLCDKEEIDILYRQVSNAVQDMEKFKNRVFSQIWLISSSLRQIVQLINAKDYEVAGRTAGGLIYVTFTN